LVQPEVPLSVVVSGAMSPDPVAYECVYLKRGKEFRTYGGWTYLILFAIVFCETGLVVTPFLPGDSLPFPAGAFCALGALQAAAIAGDTVNYWAGAWVGPRAFSGQIRFLNQRHLARTHEFHERHGDKTIIFARFVPIIRTFAPFVAGIGTMAYGRFILYNVVGGIVWVVLFCLGGYFFGNLPAVKRNFIFVILAIIVLSILPLVIEVLKERSRRRALLRPE
jgi:membrane-associated protein